MALAVYMEPGRQAAESPGRRRWRRRPQREEGRGGARRLPDDPTSVGRFVQCSFGVNVTQGLIPSRCSAVGRSVFRSVQVERMHIASCLGIGGDDGVRFLELTGQPSNRPADRPTSRGGMEQGPTIFFSASSRRPSGVAPDLLELVPRGSFALITHTCQPIFSP